MAQADARGGECCQVTRGDKVGDAGAGVLQDKIEI